MIKKYLLWCITTITLLLISNSSFSQTPELKSLSTFKYFNCLHFVCKITTIDLILVNCRIAKDVIEDSDTHLKLTGIAIITANTVIEKHEKTETHKILNLVYTL
tara:strand:- start:2094 stop:2405 length:312 start_codon:yes stop_codon:yes gene_type:complete